MASNEKTAPNPAKKSPRGALAVAINSRKPVQERIAALAQMPLAVCEKDENLQAVLNMLRDPNEPIALRLAALQTMQAASFSVVSFEPCRGDYIATLRQIADDPDPEMRQRVLGMLARDKDGFAQKRLMEGLQNPEKALVPPEKALQLLGYDVHADAYAAAREIVNQPPSDAARREALRLLAADTGSAPMFEKILRDKGEATDVRQISAAALHTMQPDTLQEYAREIVLDDSEDQDLQATSLTALTQFGDSDAIANDEVLRRRVDDLRTTAPPTVNESAHQFVDKYGQ